MMSANEDVEMKDVEDEEEDEEQVALDLDPDEGASRFHIHSGKLITLLSEPSDEEEEEEEAANEDAPKNQMAGGRNSQLMVGYKGDRSYVVRGSNIGVFDTTSDRTIKYFATIGHIATTKCKEFKPKNVCSVKQINTLLWS